MRYLKRATAVADTDRAAVRDLVATMLDEIRREGDAAVRRYAEKLDGIAPESFRVDGSLVASAGERIPAELREAIDFAEDQVRGFAEAQRATMTDLEIETRPGVVLGHHHLPVRSVGAYVPGGRYSLIASAYMSVIPARVAGVEKVAVCTPPSRRGEVHPGLLYAAHRAGADAVYAVGGVQALGAMAYGLLPGVEPVDMIVGPGNQYVVEAKRQLFGRVGIDLLAGPTEIGIVADDSADPFIVAADLVGQAEHDPLSRAVLVTTSARLGQEVLDQMDIHLKSVSTEEVARACWESGGEIIVVDDEDELVAVSDDYALEHVEVHVADPLRMIDRLSEYGSLFVGEEVTVAYGDKVSGPNHILPTRRAARFSGGLWVGKFLKTVTYQHMDRAASLEMARHCAVEATAEGMVAHARTATLRTERYGESPR
ncbi:MAG: histidinol dehydrogenase [Acidimicrobiales bacterium]